MLRNFESSNKTSSLGRFLSKRRNLLALLAILVVFSVPITVYAAGGVTVHFNSNDYSEVSAGIPFPSFTCSSTGAEIPSGMLYVNATGIAVITPGVHTQITASGHGNFTLVPENQVEPNYTGIATFSLHFSQTGSPVNPIYQEQFHATITTTGSNHFTFTVVATMVTINGVTIVQNVTNPNCGLTLPSE